MIAPWVDETMPMTWKSALPRVAMPFFEMISGCVPIFVNCTVSVVDTPPAPSSSVAGKVRGCPALVFPVKETAIPGWFRPVPLRATLAVGLTGSLLAMASMS